MLLQDYVVLHAEVWDLLVEIHVLREHVNADKLLIAEHRKGGEARGSVLHSLHGVGANLVLVDEVFKEEIRAFYVLSCGFAHGYCVGGEGVLVEDVEHVVKGAVVLAGDLDEVLEQNCLWDGEGLGQDYVVAVWEEAERVLHKVQAAALILLVDAEQIDHDCVLCLHWDVGYGLGVTEPVY